MEALEGGRRGEGGETGGADVGAGGAGVADGGTGAAGGSDGGAGEASCPLGAVGRGRDERRGRNIWNCLFMEICELLKIKLRYTKIKETCFLVATFSKLLGRCTNMQDCLMSTNHKNVPLLFVYNKYFP